MASQSKTGPRPQWRGQQKSVVGLSALGLAPMMPRALRLHHWRSTSLQPQRSGSRFAPTDGASCANGWPAPNPHAKSGLGQPNGLAALLQLIQHLARASQESADGTALLDHRPRVQPALERVLVFLRCTRARSTAMHPASSLAPDRGRPTGEPRAGCGATPQAAARGPGISRMISHGAGPGGMRHLLPGTT